MNNRKTGKGLYGFLADDASLSEKMTIEEFESKKAVPNNSDADIETVYQVYCDLVDKM